MTTQLIGLLAETFIHVGGGQSEGAVDLPVAREAVTDYPFIPGSGLKGALLDWARQQEFHNDRELFGEQNKAGQLLFGDARLLALPVRSLYGASRWITCAHLWERYRRDARRIGRNVPELGATPAQGEAFGQGEGRVILEERGFTLKGSPPEAVTAEMSALLAHDDTRARLTTSLLLLSDDDFVWFARCGLAVQARIALDEKTKVTKPGALWYEETLPPDSLFYALIGERGPDQLQPLEVALRQTPYLQVGGNETVGQGWLALAFAGGQS